MRELAERVGINHGTLSVLERGMTEPTLTTVVNIARTLEMNIECLLAVHPREEPLQEVPADVLGYVRDPATWAYVRALGKYVAGPKTAARAGRLLYKLADITCRATSEPDHREFG